MKKYKFLIIGSNGLLGSNIVKILKQKKLSYFTVARNKSDYNLNLNNYENLNKIFLKYKFDNVINCAAIIDINYCEKMYKKISVINCDLVKYLAKMSKKYKFKFVQISTDHVYKRNGIGKNKENNKIFAINNYAKSKLLAERYLNKLNNYLIIRTNFSGRKKGAFIDWLMINIKKKKNIQLFNDMYTSTIDVKSCAKIIVELTALKSKGIFNVGSRNHISKEKFSLKFANALNKQIKYKSVSSDINIVKRPKNLGLNIKKIEKKIGYKMPTINKVIKNLIKEYK